MIGPNTPEASTARFAGGLSLRQFLGIGCLFWVYVALSNLVYGYSMRTGIARVTDVPLFADWDARTVPSTFYYCPCCWCRFGPRCGFSGGRCSSLFLCN